MQGYIMTLAFIFLLLLCNCGFTLSQQVRIPVNPRRYFAFAGRNVALECTWGGYPVCCSLASTNRTSVHDYPRSKSRPPRHASIEHCTVHKAYVPSPYEMKHMRKAEELSNLSFPDESRRELIKFILDDVEDANRWLARVKVRMAPNNKTVEPTEEDYRYLSYFHYSATCKTRKSQQQHQVHEGGDVVVHHWVEFIEPITVHARHPISFFQFHRDAKPALASNPVQPTVPAFYVDTDYVLLKGGHDLELENMYAHTNAFNPRRYFFDAGTNFFSSGMAWFICAYQQKGIVFDEIFGWEYQVLYPPTFWHEVPPKLAPTYHFYNVPIQAEKDTPHSVTRFIQQIARKEDFVSFKLDIDTASVEVPIALRILREKGLLDLIDEYFFELHFNCEFLAHDGGAWGAPPPPEIDGLRMDRLGALTYFQELRKNGLRAHIWS
eukprot:scaffold857_cov152-Ochromonas_danica.AAC.26